MVQHKIEIFIESDKPPIARDVWLKQEDGGNAVLSVEILDMEGNQIEFAE